MVFLNGCVAALLMPSLADSTGLVWRCTNALCGIAATLVATACLSATVKQPWRSGVHDRVVARTAGAAAGDPAVASVSPNADFVEQSKPAAASPVGTCTRCTERAVPVATGLPAFEGEHDLEGALDVPLIVTGAQGVLLPDAVPMARGLPDCKGEQDRGEDLDVPPTFTGASGVVLPVTVPMTRGLLAFKGENDRDEDLDVPPTVTGALGVLLPVAVPVVRGLPAFEGEHDREEDLHAPPVVTEALGVLLLVAGDHCWFLAQRCA